MDAAESILHPGDRLDRYELLCPIASGGMATVWLARLRGKRGFEKLFAVKTIRTELVEEATFQEMFLDEARIASGIQHPNVAQILDLGEQGSVLFIVMEFVDGDSLAKVRKRLASKGTKLPLGVTLRLLADACLGLHAAHELRDEAGEPLDLVHRDVSPQNILVSAAGTAKIIDFGIAKAHGRKQGETRTGVVKGKIQYLAPEQVKKGAKVDRRTDVWALGACLQELVTGKLPYDGDDDIEVIRKLMTDEPPPHVEGLPAPVARILERSMALDPGARFPTAAAMHRALEAAFKELGDETTHEDVVAFLRAECPDLAAKRKTTVGKAIDEARSRPAPDELALAPTQVGVTSGARASRDSDVGTLDLVRRKGDTPIHPATNASLELDQEPIVIPKRSLAWLWVLLLLGGGTGYGAYRYPALVHRAMTTVGLESEETHTPPPPATTLSPPVAAVTSALAPGASATGTSTSSAVASSPLPSASAAPSASQVPVTLVAARRAEPGAGQVTEPEPSPAPSASTGEPAPNWSIYRTAPSATASAAPPAPAAPSATPSAAPAPAAPAASDVNPY